MNLRLRLSCATASMLLMVGCATTPYGSFVNEPPAPLDAIASDAVRKLGDTFKPAKTRVAIQHASGDQFGVAFINILRTQGYAVIEFSAPQKPLFAPLGKEQVKEKAEAAPATTDVAAAGSDAVPVSYIVDRAGDVVRLTLHAGPNVLNRAYVVNAGQFAPAGAWSLLRQE